jgi:polar amino acid transport system substrate-binding protein
MIMLSNHKPIRLIHCGLRVLALLVFIPATAFSQEESAAGHKLLVGVVAAPPVYMKTADNRWVGLGVEIWRAVAQDIGVAFEFREFNTLESMQTALETNEIDAIPAMPVQNRFEPFIDFSQSYLKSGLSIAVPSEGTEDRWMNVVKSVFSLQILKAVALMFLMSLLIGIIVWSFERRRNSEMFGGGNVKGIGSGIWWAMVTMTTVGYGDKSPKTPGGRIFAVGWMIFSIVFIAAFTATITTQLTLTELRGKVHGFDDLYHARVGCVSGSDGFNLLAKKGVAVIPFDSIREGLAAVANRKIDAFVQNEKILQYLIKTQFPGQLQTVGGTFDEYFVSVALQRNSPLRKPINQALLKFMKTDAWTELLNRYR